MLRAILNKSWQQHPTRHQVYGHLPPITKTIQARRTRHVRHCWRSNDVLVSGGPPHIANQKQDDQLEHTYSSYVMIRDVTLKTCRRRWMIGRRGERGSGISMLAARHDHDDDVALQYLLSILADLDNVALWMVSIRPLISYSSSFLPRFWRPFRVHQLQLVLPSPSCSIAFFLVLWKGRTTCLSFCFLWFSLCGPPRRQSQLFGRLSFFLLIIIRSGILVAIRGFVCILKS